MTTHTANPTLQIHPELTRPQREEGVFELTGLPGGFRVWFGYDREGQIRLVEGLNDRDVTEDTLKHFEARLQGILKSDQQQEA